MEILIDLVLHIQAWWFSTIQTRLTLDAHSCITHRRRHLSLGSCWCYRVINPCWWGCISCQLLFSQKICTTGFSRPKIKQRKFISFRNFCWNWTKCVKFQWFQRQITTGVCKLTKSVTKFHTFTLLLLQLCKKCVVFWIKKYTADKICLSFVRIQLPCWVINRDARFRDRSCDNELVQRRGLTKCIR